MRFTRRTTTAFALAVSLVIALVLPGAARATPFTSTSPAGGALPAGVSTVGGIVLDMIGANDARVVSQLAASSLFVGFFDTGSPAAFQGNPGTIGIQTGFNSSVTSALGGGLKNVAIRFTLFDGDSAAGNFDFNDNTLLVNGFNFGSWSAVEAQNTDGSGNAGPDGFSGAGFRNDILDTGWFHSTDSTLLGNIFSSIVGAGQVVYQVDDVDRFDNFFDFTQGISSSLINVGQGPTVQPPAGGPPSVPAPSGLVLLGAGLIGLGAWRRSRARA